MHTDRFGLSITAVSARALALYDETVDRLFALQLGGDALIDQALRLDPEFALAHCAKARTSMMAGDSAAARRFATRGCELASGLPRRERDHADIVRKVVHGESKSALLAVRDHAAAFPRDAVPLSFALGVYGLLGFGGFKDFQDRQVALLESVAPAWGDDWWFLASLGWAYVEAGRADDGIPMLERALVLNADNANAVHGRAHGYYEQGAAAEGAAFVEGWLPRYARAAPLHGHLSWHLALFALQRGDVERALDIYRDGVGPTGSQALPMFTMIDSAALAMRCGLYGHPFGKAALRELARFAADRFPKPGVPFVNVHLALAYAASGEDAALATLESAVEQLLADGRQASGAVVAQVCTAVAAYAKGYFADAARRLEDALPALSRLGGSHAQRDVFIDLLVGAHQRAGASTAALAAARDRWHRRAGHLDEAWLARLAHAGS